MEGAKGNEFFSLLGVISSLFAKSIPSQFSNSERYLCSDLQSIFFEYPGYQIGDRFRKTTPYNCNCVYLLKNGKIEGDAEYDDKGVVKVTFYHEDVNVRTRHYAENKKASAILRHQMDSPTPEFFQYPTLH